MVSSRAISFGQYLERIRCPHGPLKRRPSWSPETPPRFRRSMPSIEENLDEYWADDDKSDEDSTPSSQHTGATRTEELVIEGSLDNAMRVPCICDMPVSTDDETESPH